MSQSIQEFSAALVREFLSKKGLKSTLAVLDEELPRTPDSITNRATLAKDLCIESLLKKNKTLPSPYKTMIEVIVKYFVDKKLGHSSPHLPPSSPHLSPSSTPPPSAKHTQLSVTSADASIKTLHNGSHFVAHGNPITYSDANVKPSVDKQKTTDNMVGGANPATPSERVVPSGVVVPLGGVVGRKLPLDAKGTTLGSGGRSGKTRHFKARGLVDPSVGNDPASESTGGNGVAEEGVVSAVVEQRQRTHESCGVGVGASGDGVKVTVAGVKDVPLLRTPVPDTKQPSGFSQSKAGSVHGEVLCEDLENMDLTVHTSDVEEGHSGPDFPKGDPISAETAKKVRQLLFGSAKKTFSAEWKRQNLVFSSVPGLAYGLVQHKGGPCGVLACVQAYVLKHLVFSDKKVSTVIPQTSAADLAAALCSAVADILWRAGGCVEAVVTLNSQHSGTVFDPLTDRLAVYHFVAREHLHSFIAAHLHEFQDEFSSGCVLLTVSAILSRSIEKIRDDMDEKEGSLFGAHGYCTQELVNLLLCGVAASNVFNGQMELDLGGARKNILKGIPRQSEIGLLSLFEHYQSCNVGTHYKDPVYPIWVVCSESHFSVLYSPQRDLLRQEAGQFDLYYYDGLARQDEVIRLTVDTRKPCRALHMEDLVPPLELCIRTKWKNAGVCWNGTEPIL